MQIQSSKSALENIKEMSQKIKEIRLYGRKIPDVR